MTGTVLVVEDEPLVREAVQDILNADGFETICVASGHQAVEVYQAQRGVIGLVIMDIRLPGLDGAAVFAELRRLNPAVKVIISSAHGEKEVSERIGGKTAATILVKPFDADKLLTTVNKVLAN